MGYCARAALTGGGVRVCELAVGEGRDVIFMSVGRILPSNIDESGGKKCSFYKGINLDVYR